MANIELPNHVKPTLEDAIRELRRPLPGTPEVALGVLQQRACEVANDLAMAHGLIEAAEDQYERDLAEWAHESTDDAEFRTDELADKDTIAEVIALNDRAEFAEARAMGAQPPFYRPRGAS